MWPWAREVISNDFEHLGTLGEGFERISLLWEHLEKDFKRLPCSRSFLAKVRAVQGWGP